MDTSEFEIRKPNKAGRKITWLAAILLLAIVLVAGIYYLVKVNRPYKSESITKYVTIEKGNSTKQIAKQLDAQSIISNPWVFMVYVLLHNAGDKIQAGSYVLDPSMTLPEIVDILTQGRVVTSERRVTIIEGWTNQQVANYLEQRQIVSAKDFLNLLKQKLTFKKEVFNESAYKFKYQGFLFPDTYELAKSEDASDLIEKMLENFDSKFTQEMVDDVSVTKLSVGQSVILASIIEKEVGRNVDTLTDKDIEAMKQERRLVSSVFYNRLKIGMALQSDATVNFITGKGQRQASTEDTKIKSPYNTYQIVGLPPTPISNPGLDSLMAAIYPDDTDYVYFLNKPNGEAVFSKTLEEHNANKAKYLK